MQNGDMEAILGAAMEHHRAGRLDDALEASRRAVAAAPGNGLAQTLLGVALQQTGDSVAATACFEKAVEIAPDDAGAYSNLGNALLLSGRETEATTALRRAVDLDPANGAAQNNLGNLLQNQGDDQAAAAAFSRAVETAPGEARFHNNLAVVLLKLSRREEAAAAAAEAVALAPAYAQAHRTLGNALKGLGRTREALSAFHAAVRIDPDDAYSAFLARALGGETPPAPPHEYVVGLFDSYADHFEDEVTRELDYRVPHRLREMVAGIAGPGARFSRLMDLGCGAGLVGELFRDIVAWAEGVDLAPRMVELAAARGVYDRVGQADVVAALRQASEPYDLILATDVFIYVGALEGVFSASAQALEPGGLFAFSIETWGGEAEAGAGYVLRPTARYAHTAEYIGELVRDNGFEILLAEDTIIRKGQEGPIPGILFVLKALASS